MKIAVHFAIPQPPFPELDATVQDGLNIVRQIGGETNFLFPGDKVHVWFPRLLCGLHQIPHLKRLDKKVGVHHIFSNGLFPYPFLLLLKKPIVFSTVIGLEEMMQPRCRWFLTKVRHFIVSSDYDLEIMRKWGYKNVTCILPGIDEKRFQYAPCTLRKEFVLFVGSAPWNYEQFQTKGIDMLLQLAVELPWLRLVCLWRGCLFDEMVRKIARYKVQNKITLISEKVDVNRILESVHAGVLLAHNPLVVKAFPHSLLETIAAGKPVLVSDCLQLAKYVQKYRLGEVVSPLDFEDVKKGIRMMRHDYKQYINSVKRFDVEMFSYKNTVSSLKNLYLRLNIREDTN